MIKKRFTIDECGNITDTVTNRTLYVENRYTECNYYVNLLNKLNDENEQLKSENERLQHFESLYRQKTLQLEKKYNRIIDLINEKIRETENDLNCSVKAGMPTSAMYSEIELLEALRKEIEE